MSVQTLRAIQKLTDPLQVVILCSNKDGNTLLHVTLEHISIHAKLDFIAVLRLLVNENGIVLGMTNKAGMIPFEKMH